MHEFPSHYQCTSCGEKLHFASRFAFYCFDLPSVPPGATLAGERIHDVPVRPGWCKDCATVCLVEDLQPIATYEHAYGMTRIGREIDHPFNTANLDQAEAEALGRDYLRWRMGRRHRARALCCGRTDHQFLDVAQPLFKHQECDFGVVESVQVWPGPHCGPGPGVYSPANYRLYDGEGALIGLLTTRERGSDAWNVVAASYPAVESD